MKKLKRAKKKDLKKKPKRNLKQMKMVKNNHNLLIY